MADCLFCRIVAGEIPAAIVKRSDEALAFRDIETTNLEELVDCPKCLKKLKARIEILRGANS